MKLRVEHKRQDLGKLFRRLSGISLPCLVATTSLPDSLALTRSVPGEIPVDLREKPAL